MTEGKQVTQEAQMADDEQIATPETTMEGEPKDQDDKNGDKGTKVREREIRKPGR